MEKIIITFLIGSLLISSCNKKTDSLGPVTPVDTTAVIDPAIDPPVANTIGFFLDDWQPKTFTAPSFVDATAPASPLYTVTIDRSSIITKVARSLFGNNANLWMSQIVTEPSLMDHLTTIHPHIIRFPGGSISDVFFWNAQPNTPPADAPAQLLDASGNASAANFWYGKNTGSWTFSLDNYYNMLQQTGNQGLITINYGYARYGTSADPVATAAHLAADWVRYDNGRTKYWEIGNENFGDWEAGYRIKLSDNHDGQPEYLSGQLYGQHFKIFADSMHKAATEIGKTIYIAAVTVEAQSQAWQTSTYQNWNTGMLGAINNASDYNVVHSYYTPYNTNSNAADILNSAITGTKTMMDFVKLSLQNAGAATKPVALDEWNIFAVNSKQPVSHINGLHADLVLGEVLKNKFGMSSRWDLANAWDNGNDHGMFNAGDETDGVPKWNPRPAFYHMYFFQKFLGDRMVTSSSSTTDIQTYASSYTSGEVGVALVNISTTDKTVALTIKNFKKGARYYWYTLTGGGDNGEFSRKVLVNGETSAYASGGPADYKTISAYSALVSGGINVTVPARAAVFVAVDKQ